MDYPPARINKRGNKFSWNALLNKMVYEGKVAQTVIMTPSLKRIFEIFGSDILKLEAKGSKQNNHLIDELSHLGFNIFLEETNRTIMKYKNDSQTIMKNDDLDDKSIKQIVSLLEKYQIKDCAVTYLKVKIKDEQLKKIVEKLSGIKIDTDVFIAEFKSSPCEKDPKELETKLWNSLPGNKELTSELGFKRTVLNCIKLIDETSNSIFRNDDEGRWIINWKPKYDKNDPFKDIVSPKEICEVLADKIASNNQKWGFVKSYKKTTENKWSLVNIY